MEVLPLPASGETRLWQQSARLSDLSALGRVEGGNVEQVGEASDFLATLHNGRGPQSEGDLSQEVSVLASPSAVHLPLPQLASPRTGPSDAGLFPAFEDSEALLDEPGTGGTTMKGETKSDMGVAEGHWLRQGMLTTEALEKILSSLSLEHMQYSIDPIIQDQIRKAVRKFHQDRSDLEHLQEEDPLQHLAQLLSGLSQMSSSASRTSTPLNAQYRGLPMVTAPPPSIASRMHTRPSSTIRPRRELSGGRYSFTGSVGGGLEGEDSKVFGDASTPRKIQENHAGGSGEDMTEQEFLTIVDYIKALSMLPSQSTMNPTLKLSEKRSSQDYRRHLLLDRPHGNAEGTGSMAAADQYFWKDFQAHVSAELEKLKAEEEAREKAFQMETAIRNNALSKKYSAIAGRMLEEHQAAMIIQAHYRGWVQRRWFQSFRKSEEFRRQQEEYERLTRDRWAMEEQREEEERQRVLALETEKNLRLQTERLQEAERQSDAHVRRLSKAPSFSNKSVPRESSDIAGRRRKGDKQMKESLVGVRKGKQQAGSAVTVTNIQSMSFSSMDFPGAPAEDAASVASLPTTAVSVESSRVANSMTSSVTTARTGRTRRSFNAERSYWLQANGGSSSRESSVDTRSQTDSVGSYSTQKLQERAARRNAEREARKERQDTRSRVPDLSDATPEEKQQLANRVGSSATSLLPSAAFCPTLETRKLAQKDVSAGAKTESLDEKMMVELLGEESVQRLHEGREKAEAFLAQRKAAMRQGPDLDSLEEDAAAEQLRGSSDGGGFAGQVGAVEEVAEADEGDALLQGHPGPQSPVMDVCGGLETVTEEDTEALAAASSRVAVAESGRVAGGGADTHEGALELEEVPEVPDAKDVPEEAEAEQLIGVEDLPSLLAPHPGLQEVAPDLRWKEQLQAEEVATQVHTSRATSASASNSDAESDDDEGEEGPVGGSCTEAEEEAVESCVEAEVQPSNHNAWADNPRASLVAEDDGAAADCAAGATAAAASAWGGAVNSAWATQQLLDGEELPQLPGGGVVLVQDGRIMTPPMSRSASREAASAPNAWQPVLLGARPDTWWPLESAGVGKLESFARAAAGLSMPPTQLHQDQRGGLLSNPSLLPKLPGIRRAVSMPRHLALGSVADMQPESMADHRWGNHPLHGGARYWRALGSRTWREYSVAQAQTSDQRTGSCRDHPGRGRSGFVVTRLPSIASKAKSGGLQQSGSGIGSFSAALHRGLLNEQSRSFANRQTVVEGAFNTDKYGTTSEEADAWAHASLAASFRAAELRMKDPLMVVNGRSFVTMQSRERGLSSNDALAEGLPDTMAGRCMRPTIN